MSSEFLRLVDIEKQFSGVPVLKKVSLSIGAGEIRCLAGENGCGKSTLIKIISGVYDFDGGSVYIDGVQHRQLRPADSINACIQVIYQDFSLFAGLTVMENLALNTQIEQKKFIVRRKEMREIAKHCLAQINVDIDLDRLVGDLSVADKQLVAISRALVNDAKLIIMDEPTTALTQHEVDSLFEIIKGLKARGISTLFVSHKMREMLEISEKITIMRNGIVAADGDIADFDETKITYHMIGRNLDDVRFAAPKPAEAPPLLRTNSLTRHGAFKNINISLNPGEILGITGLLGSGRTELALALFGKEPADLGSIYRDGKEVHINTIQQAMAYGIAYVPEDRLTEGLFMEQSIQRNMFATIYERFVGGLGLLRLGEIDEKSADMIRAYGINTPRYRNPVRSLSGGNQQRVMLARWMMTDARILILNGPTVGVDVGSKFAIHEMLRDIARSGVGVIVCSDDMQEIIQTCNRVLIMQEGRVTDELITEGIDDTVISMRLKKAKQESYRD